MRTAIPEVTGSIEEAARWLLSESGCGAFDPFVLRQALCRAGVSLDGAMEAAPLLIDRVLHAFDEVRPLLLLGPSAVSDECYLTSNLAPCSLKARCFSSLGFGIEVHHSLDGSRWEVGGDGGASFSSRADAERHGRKIIALMRLREHLNAELDARRVPLHSRRKEGQGL